MTQGFDRYPTTHFEYESVPNITTFHVKPKGNSRKFLIRLMPTFKVGDTSTDRTEVTLMGTEYTGGSDWWFDSKTTEVSPTVRDFHWLSDSDPGIEPITRVVLAIDGNNRSASPERFAILANSFIGPAADSNFMFDIQRGTGITHIENGTIQLIQAAQNLQLGSAASIVTNPTGGSMRPFSDALHKLGTSGFSYSGMQGRTKASDPIAADQPDGSFQVWKNTGTGAVKLWYNDGGTMKGVALT